MNDAVETWLKATRDKCLRLRRSRVLTVDYGGVTAAVTVTAGHYTMCYSRQCYSWSLQLTLSIT